MVVKVAINGFGRIGRLALRLLIDDHDFNVVAINDRSDVRMLSHLFKYDSSHGNFKGGVIAKDSSIVVNNREILCYSESDPSKFPWKELEIDVVIECTGTLTDNLSANVHILAGAKKVILSAPTNGPLKTIVYGVNHDTLDGTETIISCASCTTNCLAPVAKVLNDKFGIVNGIMSTTHAYTRDQNLLDGSHKKGDLRRARAAATNIIPSTTGAAKTIGKVIPELTGKLNGSSQRVPIATGSLLELTVTLSTKVTKESINNAMKNASSESFGYTEEELVSSDIIGITHGSLFDATQTIVVESDDKQIIKVASWYDNEMSYTSQLIRTLKHLTKMICITV